MKKLSVALFVILFLAVAALFFFQFSGNKKGKKSIPSDTSANVTASGIAYVNIDTVVFKFNMYSDRREELLGKQKKAEAELNSKGTQYERGVKDYQDKVNKGLVTRATAAEIEQSLYQQQQELVTLRDKLDLGGAAEMLPLVSDVDADVIDILTSLGFSIIEAQAALQHVPREVSMIDERVQAALQYLDQS